MFLGLNGVLKCIGEGNSEYYESSRDVFFGISTNSWDFWVLVADSESSERGDSEYIGIFWICWVGWLWEKEESFFFFAGVEIEGF